MKLGNNIKRRLILALIFMGYLLLGLLKSYLLQTYNSAGELIDDENSPMTITAIANKTIADPRWYYNLLIIIIYSLFGVLVCKLCYREKFITRMVTVIYFSLILLCSLLVLIDVAIGKEFFGYSTARAIKDYLIQTPFVVLVIISGQFLFFQKRLFDNLDLKDKTR